MPIFGAKSRAARGCASKLACGRRIDPQEARPFLRYAATNLPLPNGRTETSAPTGRCAGSPKMRAILWLHPAGSMWASTPTEILCCRHSLCNIGGAPCAGGVEPLPYSMSGNIAFLRYVAANLRLPYGRTGSSAPTGAYRFALVRQKFLLHARARRWGFPSPCRFLHFIAH